MDLLSTSSGNYILAKGDKLTPALLTFGGLGGSPPILLHNEQGRRGALRKEPLRAWEGAASGSWRMLPFGSAIKYALRSFFYHIIDEHMFLFLGKDWKK